MLLRPRADRYRSGHPTAADVLLLVEVADTSLAFDRGPKLALYARHGVPEVWVVDLVSRAVEVCREPARRAMPTAAGSPRAGHADAGAGARHRCRGAAGVARGYEGGTRKDWLRWVSRLPREVAVAATTIWEIAIKTARGKLSDIRVGAHASLTGMLQAHGFTLLAIDAATVEQAAHLPPFHADPFDRAVVAAAQRSGRIVLLGPPRCHRDRLQAATQEIVAPAFRSFPIACSINSKK